MTLSVQAAQDVPGTQSDKGQPSNEDAEWVLVQGESVDQEYMMSGDVCIWT